MATFHRSSMRRTSAYVNDPGSPHHGRLGTLGKRVLGRQVLHLPEGGHIWAAATTVEPVEAPAPAWESADGKFRIGDLVAGRMGPAKVVAGPVPTPLGIVYRLESQTSGHEFDEWEHNISSASGLHIGATGQSTDYYALRKGDALVDKWGQYVTVVEPALGEGDYITLQYVNDSGPQGIVKMYAGGMEYDGFKLVTSPPYFPWDESIIEPRLQRDTPEQAEGLVRNASEGTDPDWSFVYYMGEVKLVEWSHQNRHRQILKDLLTENGKELVDDIDDTEIVGGTVTNGKVEVDGFADPDLLAKAEAAIAEELGSKHKTTEPSKDEPTGDGPTIKVEISIDGWDVKGD